MTTRSSNKATKRPTASAVAGALETSNGCDAIPLTKPMSGAWQRTEPRCKGSDKVSKEDQESLAQVEQVVKALTAAKKP